MASMNALLLYCFICTLLCLHFVYVEKLLGKTYMYQQDQPASPKSVEMHTEVSNG